MSLARIIPGLNLIIVPAVVVKNQLFADEAILAIHQGSGGLLRRANNLARGALIAAAREKCQIVSAEHVRVASTEVI